MTTKENQIEQTLINRLVDLKYTYRPDIRDKVTLEKNFRDKFEALNRVHLTDAEFARLRDEIVNADVFQTAKTPREYPKAFNQSGQYSLLGRQGALCGDVNLVDGHFYATENAVVTTPKAGTGTDWLFYNLCLLNLNRFTTGQAQPGLSIDVIEKVNCVVPKGLKEQQKIAACLSSLNELIIVKTSKLDSLKAHKKGLMQKLFPGREAVDI